MNTIFITLSACLVACLFAALMIIRLFRKSHLNSSSAHTHLHIEDAITISRQRRLLSVRWSGMKLLMADQSDSIELLATDRLVRARAFRDNNADSKLPTTTQNKLPTTTNESTPKELPRRPENRRPEKRCDQPIPSEGDENNSALSEDDEDNSSVPQNHKIATSPTLDPIFSHAINPTNRRTPNNRNSKIHG